MEPNRTVKGVTYTHVEGLLYRGPGDPWDIYHALELDALALDLTPDQASWLLYGYTSGRYFEIPETILLQLKALGLIHSGATQLGIYWCNHHHLTTSLPQIRGEGACLHEETISI